AKARVKKVPMEDESESESDSDNESEEDIPRKSKKKTKVDSKSAHGNRTIFVKTSQTGAFKQALEKIANVVSECQIVFLRPDYDDDGEEDDYGNEENNGRRAKEKSGGIRIYTLSSTKAMYIKL